MNSELLFLPLDIEIDQIDFPHQEQVTYQQRYWHTEQVVKVNEDYSNYRWLLDQLSIERVTSFTHKVQQAAVGPHVDVFDYGKVTPDIQNLIDNEPSGFHVVLKGQADSLEIFTGKRWVNPVLPAVPGIYLMNLTSCRHCVKHDHLRETLYIKGFVNQAKHQALISKNLKKYAHLAVFRE